MKRPLIFLTFLLATVGALAQGQVNFAARVVPVYDAPVILCYDFGQRPAGDQYRVQLYAGASQHSLAPIGAPLPFRTGAAAGYWAAEARTIDTVDASGNAYVQVRAWNTAFGPTFEAAQATGSGVGESIILIVKPTVAPDLPATLTGLTSFGVFDPFCIPEPSIPLLSALGCLLFLFLRRNNLSLIR